MRRATALLLFLLGLLLGLWFDRGPSAEESPPGSIGPSAEPPLRDPIGPSAEPPLRDPIGPSAEPPLRDPIGPSAEPRLRDPIEPAPSAEPGVPGSSDAAGEGASNRPVGSPEVRRRMRPMLGDLPEMQERRLVRALVAYDRSGFFLDHGRPRGFEVELLEAWEAELNRSVRRRERRIDVMYIPLAFEALLPALLEGRGDLVAANLTVTDERSKRVSFTDPYLDDVDEIVVSHAAGSAPATIEGLAGRTVTVAAGTSHAHHLASLSQRLQAGGSEGIDVVEVDGQLDSEDLLEMVHAGVFELTVADEHEAELWAQVLDGIRPHPDLVVHEGGSIAWALRPESQGLRRSLNAFLARHRKGTLLGNVLFRRYFENTRWIQNPAGSEAQGRFRRFAPIFQKYAERYGFDWLKLVAQAYQESGLDPSLVSRAGAIGLMQVLPSTAATKGVEISNLHDPQQNVHAGVKYMALLRDRYLAGPELSETARFDLTLAAYNMGPNRLARLRSEATARGLDPDRWFDHVELVALERVGQEPVRYVANVNKYYVAYTLESRRRLEKQEQRRRLLESGVQGAR